MIRKTWWLACGLVAFVGCDTGPDFEANNNVPPSPPGYKHQATSPAGQSPNAGQMPSGYPGAEGGANAPTGAPASGDAAKPAEAKSDAAKPDEAKPEAPKADEKSGDQKDAGAKAEAVKLSDEQVAEIKKLPEAEQAAALKQKVCPVSDENLGDMGVPVKVSAGGETFYLCCKGCKKDLDDPAKLKTVLSKLKTTK